MRKLFCILFAASMSFAAFAADHVFLGWKCTDQAALTAAAYDTAVPVGFRVIYKVLLAQLVTPANFDTAEKAIAATEALVAPYADAIGGEKAVKEKTAMIMTNTMVSKYAAGIYAYCAANNLTYTLHLVINNYDVGLTNTETANVIVDCLVNGTYAATYVVRAINKYIRCAATLDDAKAVADLKTLLAIYHPKVVDDATAWKPVSDKLAAALLARGVKIGQ